MAKPTQQAAGHLNRLRFLWSREIWDARYLNDKSPRGILFAALRILSLSVTGFQRNNIPVRAAALSYSSLIALAPMVAIIVMISGFILKNQGGEEFAAQKITQLITYVAPSIAEYGRVEVPPANTAVEISEDNNSQKNELLEDASNSSDNLGGAALRADASSKLISGTPQGTPPTVPNTENSERSATDEAVAPRTAEGVANPQAQGTEFSTTGESVADIREVDAVTEDANSAEAHSPAGVSPISITPDMEATVEDVELNPELVSMLRGIIQSTQSGGAGIFGILALVFIGIQLLIAIENTLNDIWGVQRGRTMVQRVIYYWAFISLGSVLSFSALSMLTTASIVQSLGGLPGGATLAQILVRLMPVFSFVLIVLLLTSFYHFFPNTRVKLKAAVAGAVCVALLLLINNYLSFLYVGQVVKNKSLYGSIAIVPVLMLGMYIFWVFILTGGQITYAFQSVDTLTNRDAWKNVSARTRETLSLAAFILICRRFEAKQEPYTFEELVEATRAPGNLLNECLNQLCEVDLLHTVSPDEDEEEKAEPRYAPAVPADKVTLGNFKDAWESYGNNDGLELILKIDPVVQHYRKRYGSFGETDAANTTVRQVMELCPKA